MQVGLGPIWDHTFRALLNDLHVHARRGRALSARTFSRKEGCLKWDRESAAAQMCGPTTQSKRASTG